MGILSKIMGDPNKKVLEKLQPQVDKINELESSYQKLTNSDLRKKTDEFRKRLKKGETLDDLLSEAFATVRESAKRTIGQRHFDVQILGGIVLHKGIIAEMKTGEGKTLASTLPLYLNALEEKGVHVVTVNDYLAKRDNQWMGPIYNLLGLSCGSIQHEKAYIFEDKGETTLEEENNLKPVERKKAYAADITYGTNNEFGFDYLRDNMVSNISQCVQKELNYAIVDEIDSILIDEARTPLIISAPAEESTEKYYQFAQLVPRLKENIDYNVDEKMKASTLTDSGIAKMEKWLGIENIYTERGIEDVHHIEQALKAQTLFKRDKDYVVRDGEVVIVDEFTGRMMFGRRYSEGLHQAIEAKEKVDIKKESRTLATITFQNYFRIYKKLSGMTGTAATEAEEFNKIYDLDVIEIPTNKPMIRDDKQDKIYKTEEAKFNAVVEDIITHYEAGQPVLVGTVSIEKNELLGDLLKRRGIPYEMLNAKNHESEAKIITQAGSAGAVTVATNMAGRGVDIKLGDDSSDSEEHKQVISKGGLYVIGTERHESRRIDNQLRGRSGRQGDPGSSSFYVSLKDDLMRLFGSDKVASIMERLRFPEDQPIEHSIITRSLESAQKKVEGHNFDIRKHLLEYDDVMNKHREVVYKRRRKVLKSKNLNSEILDMIEGEITEAVSIHFSENKTEIYEILKTIFPLPDEVKNKIEKATEQEELTEYLKNAAHNAYDEREKELGEETMRFLEKALILRSIDTLWIEHLELTDALREGISLRAYGQKDPLVEFKKEGHLMFQKLLSNIQNNVVYSIYKINIIKKPSPMENQQTHESRGGEKKEKETVKNTGEKIGRNDPCTCGSGKKYKKCCGK